MLCFNYCCKLLYICCPYLTVFHRRVHRIMASPSVHSVHNCQWVVGTPQYKITVYVGIRNEQQFLTFESTKLFN